MKNSSINLAGYEEAIRREEEELSKLLSRVMEHPLEPLSGSLSKLEKRVTDLDNAVRTVQEEGQRDIVSGIDRVEEALCEVKSNTDSFKGDLAQSAFVQSENLKTSVAKLFDQQKNLERVVDVLVDDQKKNIEHLVRESTDEHKANIDRAIHAFTVEHQGIKGELDSLRNDFDARINAEFATLRSGLEAQDEKFRRGIFELEHRLQAHHEVKLGDMTRAITDLSGELSHVRWIGVAAVASGIAAVVLLLMR
ncbi:hypothetical protein [Paraburkholderia hospita]|uniref:hypothetical protein n=1 Tax=Paraburkholderia hospita TaxID=169430 RepID=UPI000B3493DD|nr:hypothetical protein [Paraburkholderia hospita]OUL93040.1 hypothetical protein CA601_10955 [Paraburkholderia hospita]